MSDSGLTTGASVSLIAAAAAGWIGAPYLGRYAAAARVAAVGLATVGAFGLVQRLRAGGGLAGVLAGTLAPKRDTTETTAEQGDLPAPAVTNPGAAAGSEFLRLHAEILSPREGETLHARTQLTVDGTYPVDLIVRNDRTTSSRGFVRILTEEDTIFGPEVSGGVSSDVLTIPAHSLRRLTLNVPAASGRASISIAVTLFAAWVQLEDNRERDLGRRNFVVS